VAEDARIEVSAVVAVGPAVKSAILHGGEIIRDQIAPELVPFVHYGPKRAGLWLPRHAIWISQTRCEETPLSVGQVDFEDRGAVLLLVHAVLGDIAVEPTVA